MHVCNHMNKANLLGRGGAFESKYLRCELILYDLLSLAGCSYKKSDCSTMYCVSAVQSVYIFDNCTFVNHVLGRSNATNRAREE